MVIQTQDDVLTTEELAYIAGLFDGEGTVTISVYNASRYGGRQRRILMVMLSSTDRSIIDFLLRLFNGSLTITKAHGNHKEIYRWTLSARMAADFLSNVLPYLRIKREHAILGLEWQATVKHSNQYLRQNPNVLDWQDFYISKIRKLNTRGNGNGSSDA